MVLMLTSDKYLSNLDITRTFHNLELNNSIFLSLYSGFAMVISCICGLYAALTIRRKLCYCVRIYIDVLITNHFVYILIVIPTRVVT